MVMSSLECSKISFYNHAWQRYGNLLLVDVMIMEQAGGSDLRNKIVGTHESGDG